MLRKASCPVCLTEGEKRIKRVLGEYECLECPCCSFEFIHPFSDGRPEFDDYGWTRDYTERFETYLGSILHSMTVKVSDYKRVTGHPPRAFLDIGCGNGLYLHAANVLGIDNLGTDVDRINVAFAQERGLNATAGDIMQIDPGRRFDFIHVKAVLHLVPDPVGMMRRAAELLEPGGVVYVDVPNQGSLFSLLKKLRDRKTYGQLELPLRRGAFNKRSLRYLCEATGFRVAKWVFTYPGHRIYYPILGMHRGYRTLFRMASGFRVASFIGTYLLVGKDVPNAGRDR